MEIDELIKIKSGLVNDLNVASTHFHEIAGALKLIDRMILYDNSVNLVCNSDSVNKSKRKKK